MQKTRRRCFSKPLHVLVLSRLLGFLVALEATTLPTQEGEETKRAPTVATAREWLSVVVVVALWLRGTLYCDRSG